MLVGDADTLWSIPAVLELVQELDLPADEPIALSDFLVACRREGGRNHHSSVFPRDGRCLPCSAEAPAAGGGAAAAAAAAAAPVPSNTAASPTTASPLAAAAVAAAAAAQGRDPTPALRSSSQKPSRKPSSSKSPSKSSSKSFSRSSTAGRRSVNKPASSRGSKAAVSSAGSRRRPTLLEGSDGGQGTRPGTGAGADAGEVGGTGTGTGAQAPPTNISSPSPSNDSKGARASCPCKLSPFWATAEHLKYDNCPPEGRLSFYGGAGVIFSVGLMKRIAESRPNLLDHYSLAFQRYSGAGDTVLSEAMRRIGVGFTPLPQPGPHPEPQAQSSAPKGTSTGDAKASTGSKGSKRRKGGAKPAPVPQRRRFAAWCGYNGLHKPASLLATHVQAARREPESFRRLVSVHLRQRGVGLEEYLRVVRDMGQLLASRGGGGAGGGGHRDGGGGEAGGQGGVATVRRGLGSRRNRRSFEEQGALLDTERSQRQRAHVQPAA